MKSVFKIYLIIRLTEYLGIQHRMDETGMLMATLPEFLLILNLSCGKKCLTETIFKI